MNHDELWQEQKAVARIANALLAVGYKWPGVIPVAEELNRTGAVLVQGRDPVPTGLHVVAPLTNTAGCATCKDK